MTGLRSTKIATQVLSILLSTTDEEVRRVACYLENTAEDSIPIRLRKSSNRQLGAVSDTCSETDNLSSTGDVVSNMSTNMKGQNRIKSHANTDRASTQPASSAASDTTSSRSLLPLSATRRIDKQKSALKWSREELDLVLSLMAQNLPRKEIVTKYQIWCLRKRRPHRTSGAIFFKMAMLRKAERERGSGRYWK